MKRTHKTNLIFPLAASAIALASGYTQIAQPAPVFAQVAAPGQIMMTPPRSYSASRSCINCR